VIAAPARERGAVEVQLEAVVLADPRDEGVELGGGNIANAPALLAHKMAVCAREVEERRTVRLVHVLHVSPVVQGVEGAVHGREMDLRVRVVNSESQVVGSQVLRRAREQLDDQPSCGRNASPVGSERVERAGRLLAHDVNSPLCARTRSPSARVVQLQGVRIWPKPWISKTRCS
jgi:hypothetical protein